MTSARTRARVFAVIVALTLAMPATHAAAEPSAKPPAGTQAPWGVESEGAVADEARAQASFELGKQAIVAGRFADARRHFEASLVRVPRVSAAFNLAIAYRGIGMPVETLETLERIERGIYGPLREDRREQIRQLSAEARRDIGQLDIHVVGPETALVRVDGVDVGTATRGAPLVVPANPGAHTVSARSEGYTSLERQASVKPGERAGLTFTLTPAPRPDLRTAEGQSGNVFRSPWFWISAGVVLTGAVVGTAFIVTAPTTRDPVTDPTFGVTPTTISWR